MKKPIGLALACPFLLSEFSKAETDGPVRIGVMNDQNGPCADFSGPDSVIAARLAHAVDGPGRRLQFRFSIFLK